jgi:hypothetical protein
LYEILIRNTEDKDYLEDLGTGGRVWIGFIWLRVGISDKLLLAH